MKRNLTYDKDTGIFYSNGNPIGTKTKGYLQIWFEGKMHSAHKLAWFLTYGEWPKGFIDHINRDRSDNRISNLRLCTNAQNQANTEDFTGHKGVRFQDGAFVARIRHAGKREYLGRYPTLDEAKKAYNRRAKEIHGDFFQ